jgi:hypothetical protein
MNLRLHPLYKKFLLLCIVLGPIVWLTLTEDGRRRTDIVMLHLFGKEELNLAIEHLSANMTEADFRAQFPDLELGCSDTSTPFGDRLCAADVGSFNAVPSRGFTLFLSGQALRAAKLSYRPAYHETLVSQLTRRLGRGADRTEGDAGAMSWHVSDGILLMPVEAPETESEAALMWLSAAALSR